MTVEEIQELRRLLAQAETFAETRLGWQHNETRGFMHADHAADRMLAELQHGRNTR